MKHKRKRTAVTASKCDLYTNIPLPLVLAALVESFLLVTSNIVFIARTLDPRISLLEDNNLSRFVSLQFIKWTPTGPEYKTTILRIRKLPGMVSQWGQKLTVMLKEPVETSQDCMENAQECEDGEIRSKNYVFTIMQPNETKLNHFHWFS